MSVGSPTLLETLSTIDDKLQPTQANEFPSNYKLGNELRGASVPVAVAGVVVVVDTDASLCSIQLIEFKMIVVVLLIAPVNVVLCCHFHASRALEAPKGVKFSQL